MAKIMAKDFLELLTGNDLRSLGKNSEIISLINDQKTFDELFIHLYNQDRAIVMKTIDVIEKITLKHKEYLQKHKSEILKISKNVENIELKWHLAQILARIKYANDEMEIVWKILKQWIVNKGESKIVRVNSLQSLYEIVKENNKYENDLKNIVKTLKQENIASINARIKKLGL
jgi:methionyl-tRNA formyltransferase